MSVYFVQAGENGPVKIGYSQNPEERVVAIGDTCKVPLKLIRTIDGGYEHEKWLHHHFKDNRIFGEWFKYDAEMLSVQPSAGPAPVTNGKFLNLRLDDDVMNKLDRWRRDKAQRDNRDISRSEAIRMLIGEGIAE